MAVWAISFVTLDVTLWVGDSQQEHTIEKEIVFSLKSVLGL